jgi:hypothetical protein
MLTNPAIKAYASIRRPEEVNRQRSEQKSTGLLSRTRKYMSKDTDEDKLEPKDRIEKYVTELRMKRKALHDGRK